MILMLAVRPSFHASRTHATLDIEERTRELEAAALVADRHGIGIDDPGQVEVRRHLWLMP